MFIQFSALGGGLSGLITTFVLRQINSTIGSAGSFYPTGITFGILVGTAGRFATHKILSRAIRTLQQRMKT